MSYTSNPEQVIADELRARRQNLATNFGIRSTEPDALTAAAAQRYVLFHFFIGESSADTIASLPRSRTTSYLGYEEFCAHCSRRTVASMDARELRSYCLAHIRDEGPEEQRNLALAMLAAACLAAPGLFLGMPEQLAEGHTPQGFVDEPRLLGPMVRLSKLVQDALPAFQKARLREVQSFHLRELLGADVKLHVRRC